MDIKRVRLVNSRHAQASFATSQGRVFQVSLSLFCDYFGPAKPLGEHTDDFLQRRLFTTQTLTAYPAFIEVDEHLVPSSVGLFITVRNIPVWMVNRAASFEKQPLFNLISTSMAHYTPLEELESLPSAVQIRFSAYFAISLVTRMSVTVFSHVSKCLALFDAYIKVRDVCPCLACLKFYFYVFPVFFNTVFAI